MSVQEPRPDFDVPVGEILEQDCSVRTETTGPGSLPWIIEHYASEATPLTAEVRVW
jgi:hypothetical protein